MQNIAGKISCGGREASSGNGSKMEIKGKFLSKKQYSPG